MTEIARSEVLLRAFAILGASVAVGYTMLWVKEIERSRLPLFVFTLVLVGCFFWFMFSVKLFLWLMLFVLLLALVVYVLAFVWERLRNPETFVIFMMFTFFVLVVGAILAYRAPA